MVQEASGQQRAAFVAGAHGKVKKRLLQFGVSDLVSSRQEALERALNIVNPHGNLS